MLGSFEQGDGDRRMLDVMWVETASIESSGSLIRDLGLDLSRLIQKQKDGFFFTSEQERATNSRTMKLRGLLDDIRRITDKLVDIRNEMERD